MKILMTGSSGLVGTALIHYLEKNGHEVFKLVRKDGKLPEDLDLYENMDAAVNLAGESIASFRWSEAKKKNILESRVETTKTLCQILSSLKNPPSVLINASATGFYGDRGDESLTEESAPGSNFLSEVCQKWENATSALKKTKIRVVFLRTGVVLSRNGGMLAKLKPASKMGLAGALGSGKQYFSFIDIDDLVRIILFAIENQDLSGAINAVSPCPVTNEEFTKSLGKVMHRFLFLRVPSFALKLLLGQMAEEMMLASQKVYPSKLIEAGFNFDYPTITSALEHELK